jgi:hypothetical protein
MTPRQVHQQQQQQQQQLLLHMSQLTPCGRFSRQPHVTKHRITKRYKLQETRGSEALEVAGSAPAVTPGQQQCSVARLVARGCYACNPSTNYCTKCKTGYILHLKNVNCLTSKERRLHRPAG